MTPSLKPYSAYKDSGVPWLEQVPEHWQLVPATVAYAPKSVRNKGMAETTVLSLSHGHIVVKPPERLHGLVPASLETYQIVDPGDVIIRTTDLQNDHSSLRVGFAGCRGIITAAYMCLSCTNRTVPEYGYQLMNVFDLTKAIYGFGSGLRQNLDFADIERMPVLLPPIEEQSVIVRYLDCMDRKIRKYIRAKQRLIALLNEQKQAIIQRAVTRGLDPNVRLRPSGVPWLGDIPEHWGVLRLKYACHRIVGGSTPKSDKTEYWDGDVVWVTPVDVAHSPCLETSLRRITREGLNSCAATLVPTGSIIITCRAPVGKVSVAATELCTNQGCKAIVLRPAVLTTAFGALLLRTLEPELQSLANGTTFSEISLHSLSCVLIPVPTTDEQSAIVQYVESATASLDEAIRAAHREIDLLREYHTRLIADVVTGKLDVRDAVANLPDESEVSWESGDEEPAEAMPDLESEEESDDEQAET